MTCSKENLCGVRWGISDTWQSHNNADDVKKAIDGSYLEGWGAKSYVMVSGTLVEQTTCEAETWMRIKLNNHEDHTTLFTTAVRVHIRPNETTGLEGAEIRVGSAESYADSEHQVCNQISDATGSVVLLEPGAHAVLDLACTAEGNYIFLVQPNPVCMNILEFEVVGRRHGCTKCAAGKYAALTGSSACSSCPWAWDESAPWRLWSDESSESIQSCTCMKGMTGSLSGRELVQDIEAHRPTYAGSIALGNFSLAFNRTRRQFLHAPLLVAGSIDRTGAMNLHHPHAFHVKSGGGLTIAVTVKFTDGDCSGSSSGTGTCDGEKILDLGNAKNAISDNIALGRYSETSQLVAQIADGSSRVCEIVSQHGTIEPGKWMAIVLQYDANSNQVMMRKNGNVVAGPSLCMEGGPSDRNITRMLVGKSNFDGDAFFSGEIRELYVADQILRNLTTVCTSSGSDTCSGSAWGSGPGSSCVVQQSSTFTPDVGTQKHRDQGIISSGGSSGLACKALDGKFDSCSQTWRETSPWWRIDLEVPRLIVSVRVHKRTDCCQGDLEGFEIRVGNWPTWQNNPVCAFGVTVPHDQLWVDVHCQGEGRNVFVVLPGANRSLSLCEIEVIGLLNATSAAISGLLPNCTECIAGLSAGGSDRTCVHVYVALNMSFQVCMLFT